MISESAPLQTARLVLMEQEMLTFGNNGQYVKLFKLCVGNSMSGWSTKTNLLAWGNAADGIMKLIMVFTLLQHHLGCGIELFPGDYLCCLGSYP
jgi:hypothetical protein